MKGENGLIKKAIIPAAGYGTRSLPITKVIPKEMFPIGGKPAIQYVVEEAVAAGIEEILIVVSRSKNLIMDYFDESLELEAFLKKMNKIHLLEKTKLPDVHIQYIRQPYARGLGDAILHGKHFANNQPVAVLLPDDIFIGKGKLALEELLDLYKKKTTNVIGIKSVHKQNLKDYGVIEGKEVATNVYQLSNIIEKPVHNPPSNLAVTGRYIFNPSIFRYLEGLTTGRNGEIQLTDAINASLKEESCFAVECLSERYDIGKEKEYITLVNKILES